MTKYTARQLRTIADRLEGFTKARQANEAMGVPTTPDTFPARFPSGHLGVVAWQQAGLTSAAARERGEAPYRYVVDLGPGQADSQAVTVDIRGGTVERMGDIARAAAKGHAAG